MRSLPDAIGTATADTHLLGRLAPIAVVVGKPYGTKGCAARRASRRADGLRVDPDRRHERPSIDLHSDCRCGDPRE